MIGLKREFDMKIRAQHEGQVKVMESGHTMAMCVDGGILDCGYGT